jgi:beta-catenin-like protein 1
MVPQIPINKKNKKESYQEELEERIISLIASLFGKLESHYLSA